MDRFLKVGFSIFALLAVVFGFVRINQSIKLTFNTTGAKTSTAADDSSLDEAKLRVKDTDEDGLLDWDELNVYGTSPYLADTDSDGVSDRDEINQGSDPNCPVGRNCGLTPSSTSDEKEPTTLEDLISGSAVQDVSPEDQSAFLQELQSQGPPTADEIRDLLIQGGVSSDQLVGVTDEDLLNLFDEVLLQQQQQLDSSQ